MVLENRLPEAETSEVIDQKLGAARIIRGCSQLSIFLRAYVELGKLHALNFGVNYHH